tara:strand:- start:72 stop:653 length:582 start_codon:yes stop_codon:yes gene_type:complete
LPEKINPLQHYVFYSHGKIVEGNNPKPHHLEWGMYNFPAVKAQLADSSYTLIAKHRAKNINAKDAAEQLAKSVNQLLSQGVKAQNISLVGFSRGGGITILAAQLLQLPQLNVALLASCLPWMKNNDSYRLIGSIFSIYETSDTVGSCKVLVEQSTEVSTFKELAITTELSHGAFYSPNPVWLVPLKQWLKRPL